MRILLLLREIGIGFSCRNLYVFHNVPYQYLSTLFTLMHIPPYAIVVPLFLSVLFVCLVHIKYVAPKCD